MLPSLTALLTAVIALAVVLALVWLAARGARMVGLGARAGNGRMLRAVDSLALDPRRRLHLIGCGERHVLLLTGGGADVVVGWVPEMSGPSAVAMAAGGGFAMPGGPEIAAVPRPALKGQAATKEQAATGGNRAGAQTGMGGNEMDTPA